MSTIAFVFLVFCTATMPRPARHSPAPDSSTATPAVSDSAIKPKQGTVKPAPATPSKKTLAVPGKKLPPAAKAGPTAADKVAIEAGKQLLTTSDCLTCHKVQEKLVGPAYEEVARKYPVSDANISLLTNKIITGGGGVWGQVPMTPHPSLSQEDARKMVRYILSLSSK